MKLGIHLAIEHKIDELPILCKKYNIDCFQFFTKSPRKWSQTLINENIAISFKQNMQSQSINSKSAFIHCSYLINPANPTPQTFVELENEFENAYKLDIYNVVLHPGSCKSADCLKTASNTIKHALDKYPNIRLLLENTTRIGSSIEDLKIIAEEIGTSVFYCLDTCHLFATGYNLDVDTIDKILNIKNVKLWHLNDSKAPFGSKLDRHANIGKGQIGIKNIINFLSSKKLQNASVVLETPGTNKTRSVEVQSLRLYL